MDTRTQGSQRIIYFEFKMATSIYCALLLLFAICGAIPLQQRSPRGADYSNYEEEVKVIFPDTFNEALPNIQGLQSEMVSLMNKTLISQESIADKLENMEVILPDIKDSQNEMVSLMNKTVILPENIVDKLENNEMVSLMNKTLSVVDKTENHLENIAASLPEIQNSQSEMVTLMNKTVELLEHRLTSMTELMGTMINILQDQLYTQRTGFPTIRDCQDIAAKSAYTEANGPYTITPPEKGPLDVYCDMEHGGWTVIQKRYDNTVDFYRNWTEYENGFGDANGEYWLGLKNIRRLISGGNTWALRIDLESFDEESAYAVYDTFSIRDAGSNYRLAVGEYSGTAGDSLNNPGGVHNGMQFSTFDRDNDRRSGINCASSYQGAFWYNSCHLAHLNGKYLGRGGTDDWKGMIWFTWKQKQSLKTSEMKIRRVL